MLDPAAERRTSSRPSHFARRGVAGTPPALGEAAGRIERRATAVVEDREREDVAPSTPLPSACDQLERVHFAMRLAATPPTLVNCRPRERRAAAVVEDRQGRGCRWLHRPATTSASQVHRAMLPAATPPALVKNPAT